ncbi:MAG: hypothetical protein ACP5C4_09430 [Methanomicrobiales archaeon]
MSEDDLPVLSDEEEMYLEEPYGGLFGGTVMASVVEEMVADPTMEYHPRYLEELTGKSGRSISDALKKLERLSLVERIERDHAVYRVNVRSKKFVALTLLAYAMLDDRDGSECMDTAVRDYYNSFLREHDEPLAIANGDRSQFSSFTGSTDSPHSRERGVAV